MKDRSTFELCRHINECPLQTKLSCCSVITCQTWISVFLFNSYCSRDCINNNSKKVGWCIVQALTAGRVQAHCSALALFELSGLSRFVSVSVIATVHIDILYMENSSGNDVCNSYHHIKPDKRKGHRWTVCPFVFSVHIWYAFSALNHFLLYCSIGLSCVYPQANQKPTLLWPNCGVRL